MKKVLNRIGYFIINAYIVSALIFIIDITFISMLDFEMPRILKEAAILLNIASWTTLIILYYPKAEKAKNNKEKGGN